MNPKLQQIRIFVAVYEEQSFTAAATREQISQSGISQHIKQLEDQLGVTLFNRQYSLEPTPASHAYYQRCVELLRAHATINEPLDTAQREVTGTLRVALVQAITRTALTPTLIDFEKKYPRVDVEISEAHAAVIVGGVRRRQFDFGIVPRMLPKLPGLRSTVLARSPVFLVSSWDAPGPSHNAPVRLRDLGGLRLIMGPSGARRMLLEHYLLVNSVELTERLDTMESVQGALGLVRSTRWQMILPGCFIAGDLRRNSVKLNPIVDPPLWEDVVLVEPECQPLSTAARAFLDLLERSIGDVNELPTRIVLNASRGTAPSPSGTIEGVSVTPAHISGEPA